MKAQIIGRFENSQAMVFAIGKKLKLKGITGFEVKSTDNGGVYIESDNENALAFAYKLKCRLEKLEAQE